MRDEPNIMSVQTSTVDPEEIDYKDLYLRTLADFQNYKRRTGEEFDRLKKEATFDFIKDFLSIVDDFEMSVLMSELYEKDNGIKIIYKEICQLLGKYGIKEYGKIGDKFDPELHEALYRTINKKVESGCISEIVKTGYRTDDKIIRYAKVNVEE